MPFGFSQKTVMFAKLVNIQASIYSDWLSINNHWRSTEGRGFYPVDREIAVPKSTKFGVLRRPYRAIWCIIIT